jgi:microcystin-dependent protein
MSSTYSDNLKIELIGTGEQAGNWGSTTNTNLGTLIEQAISGVVTQPMSDADQTITIPNGATGVARNMFIECTGALTAARSLIVPTNKKLYFVSNATTGGFAITVKVSGQTGVSVPMNAKVILVMNSAGTDIVTATNYMTGATFPSPTLTGTPVAPTASAGTNTTQIATTAFVQAAALTGEIKMWGVSSAPTGYLLCNGAAVSRTTYAALYAVYGTTFGVGDGSTTFNVPDFSGKMPIGVNGTYTLASTGGAATTTISSSNLPSHTHTFSATSGSMSANASHQHGVLGSAGYHYVADGGQNNGGSASNPFSLGSENYGNYTTSQNLDHTHSVSGTTGSTGSGTAATTISPYLGIYYIIKT